MNNSKRDEPQREEEADSPQGTVNLKLVYGFIALALIAAIGFAVLIVLPFYHRR
jgi:hypothetical protein